MNTLWTPRVLKIEQALQGQMRLVGGCVRDFLLNKTPDDTDIATPLPPNQATDRLIRAGIPVRSVAPAHGVIQATVDGTSFEITTLRQDIYTSRGERIVFIDDYRLDSGRRDFTVNALSLDRAGTLYDYHNGQADLQARTIRFIGDPATRLAQDPLRILRYVRFWAGYGGKDPDNDILNLFPRFAPGLRHVSRTRQQKELSKIQSGPRAEQAQDILHQTGVWTYLTLKENTHEHHQ